MSHVRLDLRSLTNARCALRALVVLAVGAVAPVWAQEAPEREAGRVVVVGVVTDAETDAPVPFATVAVVDAFTGVAAGEDGRYRLRAAPGQRLRVRALGYAAAERRVPASATPGDTLRLDVALAPDRIPLGAVTVEGTREEEAASVYRLSGASLRNAPALGEPDPVRTLAYLPGVTQANDFQSRLNVRGGAVDQNLFLLDGVEVYDPRHLIGVFSAFNPWALEGVTFRNGVFPARYAGRLSSVVALDTRTPRADTLDATVHLSLLSSGGVATKRFGRTGVMVAARRTYLDLLSRAVALDLGYRFHDVHAKVTHRLTPTLDVEAFGFLSTDVARQQESDGVPDALADSLTTRTDWGTRMAALRVKHRAGPLAHRLTASYSGAFDEARYARGAAFADNAFHDAGVRYDATLPLRRHRPSVGVHVRRLTSDYAWDSRLGLDLDEVFYPGVPAVLDARRAQTLASLYAADDVLIGTRLTASVGLRYTTPGGLGDGVAAPRLHLRYAATDRLTLEAGAGTHVQFVAEGRQGDEFSIGSPLFLFDTPQRVRAVTTGASLRAGRYRLRADAYLRGFSDLVRLANTEEEPEAFPRFDRERGRAYGLDLMVEKTRGWITFQGAYTFLRTETRRAGRYLVADYDVPHTVQGLLGVRIGRAWLLNLAGVYRSGTPYTAVTGRFFGFGFPERDLAGRTDPSNVFRRYLDGAPNAQRFPAYVRLDVSLRRTYVTSRFRWTLYLQALNLLNRRNDLRVDWRDYYRAIDTRVNGEVAVGDTEQALPVLPSVGVEVVF